MIRQTRIGAETETSAANRADSGPFRGALLADAAGGGVTPGARAASFRHAHTFRLSLRLGEEARPTRRGEGSRPGVPSPECFPEERASLAQAESSESVRSIRPGETCPHPLRDAAQSEMLSA